jgi:hypothetical protein
MMHDLERMLDGYPPREPSNGFQTANGHFGMVVSQMISASKQLA